MQRQEHQKTAILIFARSANEEVNHKFIERGEQLFDALTADTLAKVKHTKLPYFHYTEHQQRGLSFGERYANAIQSIFDLGFERIITVGNDSPQLKSRHILEAAKGLAKGKNVLGPCIDGGFYLLGLQQQHFKKTAFLKLPWQTQKVSVAVQHYLFALGAEAFKLEVLTDIDSAHDAILSINTAKSISRKIRIVLLDLFKSFQVKGYAPLNFIQTNFLALPDSVRGSP